MWIIQPLEIKILDAPTGKFRLTARSDEDGGGPFGLCDHEHESPEAARQCPEAVERSRAYVGRPEASSGIELIQFERNRQISVEGYTIAHDNLHEAGEIAAAAACYALHAAHQSGSVDDPSDPINYSDGRPEEWPWEAAAWKPSKDRLRNLVKAGALIVAEIDRLQRRDDANAERSGGTSAPVTS